MLTARGHPDDVLQGFAAGADDYLTKPFELAILIARISGLLRRREWLRASMNHVTEPLAGPPAGRTRRSPSATSRCTSTGWNCTCATRCFR
jgi:DNA-binding response OmpR family regulator